MPIALRGGGLTANASTSASRSGCLEAPRAVQPTILHSLRGSMTERLAWILGTIPKSFALPFRFASVCLWVQLPHPPFRHGCQFRWTDQDFACVIYVFAGMRRWVAGRRYGIGKGTYISRRSSHSPWSKLELIWLNLLVAFCDSRRLC